MIHQSRRSTRPTDPRAATPRAPAPPALDADADICRRAWVGCETCTQAHQACSTCRDGRTCEWHWRYLLATTGRHLFLQCPACLRRWWHDTHFGHGPLPLDLTQVLDPPRERPLPEHQ